MTPYDALTQSSRLNHPELSSHHGGRGTPLGVLISSTAYRSVLAIERLVKTMKSRH
jgi:hypothetical protein